jgi:hypothetical protein
MRTSIRSLLGVALAGVFVLGATTVQADVYVLGNVEKTKTKTVEEYIYITKYVDFQVIEDIYVDAVSEQEIIKNQRNEFNFVEDENAVSTAEILDGSGVGVNGVVLINQSPGFENNQGNEVSITYATSPLEGTFAHAQVAVQQINDLNEYANVLLPGSVNTDTIGTEGETEGPFANGTGIVEINQAAGHMNNQDNADAIALGDFTVFALGEIDLGQFNTDNYVDVVDQLRSDTITGGAFAGFSGIVKVNQSAGSMNNQANMLDIAADTMVNANPFECAACISDF